MWKEFIGRLDEVVGCGMLTSIAIVAMVMNYDHGLAMAAVSGVVAILAVGATKKPPEDNRTWAEKAIGQKSNE